MTGYNYKPYFSVIWQNVYQTNDLLQKLSIYSFSINTQLNVDYHNTSNKLSGIDLAGY